MVKSFQFARLPFIHFGNGRLNELPQLIKRFGKTILLITGKSSFLNSVRGRTFISSLQNNDISHFQIIVSGEPSPGTIDEAVMNFSKNSVNVVVAIGGGSVMDAGKAISAMLTTGGNVTDYLEGVGIKDHPGTKIPFIAVPTTSGTGSEATKNAVISETGVKGFKRSLRHDNFIPDFAVVDPELTLNCPQKITAESGMDCFSQLVESFLSNKSNKYSDALAIEGIMAIKSSLLRAYLYSDDPEARTGMAFAALTSGICLTNAGLGAVHGFASSIGGMYNIPHGLICGTLMGAANEINVRELRKLDMNSPVLKKYTQLGKIFLDDNGRSNSYLIDGFINYLHRMTEDLQLPGIGSQGIDVREIEFICRNTENKNNPVKLGLEEKIEIITRRF
jgi:alcohol dehydrogenase class IV